MSTPTPEQLADDLAVPPLENGDFLTRDEFERRYAAMPHIKKAELIEGIVYMTSPLKADHGIPHADLGLWLSTYRVATPGTLTLDNVSYRIDQDNEFQPDLILMIAPERGGRGRIDKDGFVEGAPELIVEVASSSTSKDLHQKFNVYRRAGVQEYCVWQVRDRAIAWWELRIGRYEPLPANAEGVLRSRIFPGLWLDAPALLRGDMPAVLERLQAGLRAPEHAAFIVQIGA